MTRLSRLLHSKLLEPARACYDDRPRTPPPADRLHEFLEVPGSTGESEIANWIGHFERTGTPFTVGRMEDGRVQLYCHRIVAPQRGDDLAWWCCDPARGKARVGKRKRTV